MEKLTLTWLPETFAVCRLEADGEVPAWAVQGDHWSLTRRGDELSLVVREQDLPTPTPDGFAVERGWRALEVSGPLPFDAIGIIARIADALGRAGIPIFVVSTYDTDLVLVKAVNEERAATALASV